MAFLRRFLPVTVLYFLTTSLAFSITSSFEDDLKQFTILKTFGWKKVEPQKAALLTLQKSDKATVYIYKHPGKNLNQTFAFYQNQLSKQGFEQAGEQTIPVDGENALLTGWKSGQTEAILTLLTKYNCSWAIYIESIGGNYFLGRELLRISKSFKVAGTGKETKPSKPTPPIPKKTKPSAPSPRDQYAGPSASVAHEAAMMGDLQQLKLAIKTHAKLLQSKDSKGWTPLHHAVVWDNTEAVSLLMKAGANPRSKDNADRTPIDYARELSNRQINQLLNQ